MSASGPSGLQKAILREFELHGAGRWPKGLAQKVADETGSTCGSVTARKSQLAKTWKQASTPAPASKPRPERKPAKPKPTLETPAASPVQEPAIGGISPEHLKQIGDRAGGAYTPQIIRWLAEQGFIRSITHHEAITDFKFDRTRQTETGGILICHNPHDEQPHYQLRCDVAPIDEDRGRAAKYLMQSEAGPRLAVWDPSGQIGPDGREIGQARVGTEGFFDAVFCTVVLGTPCMAITAPSHLRTLQLPDHLKAYVGDCDQWMPPDLLPSVVRGCVGKGLKLARLPLVGEHRQAYLGSHRDLPSGAKGGMEELGLAHGIDGARQILEGVISTAMEPGDYLRWEINELAELGLRWPEHSVSINNLVSAMADAHPNNKLKREALKAAIVRAIPNLTAKPVNDGIKERLTRRENTDLEERKRQRERAEADALARGETPEPEIDREKPTSLQLQQWLAYSHTIRWDSLKRVPIVDGHVISELELTYQLLAQQHGIEAGKAQASDALRFVAKSNAFNPVEEYLESIRDNDDIGLMPRQELTGLFGLAAHDAVSAEMLELGLRGTAARGLQPGTEFDHCPILRSEEQGLGKTKALKALASQPWFDCLGEQEKGQALGDWKVTSKVASCWILELGEIDKLTQAKQASAVKEWITTNIDTYAEKNEKIATEHPRPCVPWGTTNQQELLNDETGSRRYLIIEVVRRIDFVRIAENRDRIWRTALKQLEAGAPLHLDQDTEAGRALLQASEERGRASTFSNPQIPLVLAYLQAVVDAHRSRPPEETVQLARTGKWQKIHPEGDEVEMLRLRYIPVGHKDSGQLALFVTINDLHDAVGHPPSTRNKGTSASLTKVMRAPEITSLGWARGQSKKHGGRGFQLLLSGPGGDGHDSGHDSPCGPDSGMVPRNPGPDSDFPMVPILSKEMGSTHKKTSVSTKTKAKKQSNSVSGVAGPPKRIGTRPHPSEGKASRSPFENGAHLNGDHKGEKAGEEPARGVKNQQPALTNGFKDLNPSPVVIKPASPVAFTGDVPEGITYVSRPDDLPEITGMGASLGFDLETFNRRTDLWRHHASLSPRLGGEIRLAQIHDRSTTWVIDVAVIGQPALDWLSALVRDRERILVGHNLLFEATFLIAAGIRPLCRWWDTMLACQLIGDLASNSLAAASEHYLKRPLDKAEQVSDWGNELTSSQLQYAALDAVVVHPLACRLKKELERTGQLHVHALECQMVSPCADGQVRGLAVDQSVATAAETSAAAELKQKATCIQEQLGIDNYRSVAQLKPALSRVLETELPDTRKKTLGGYDTHPVVALYLEAKALEQETKELKWLRQEADLTDGRVRPSYQILQARTGRTTTRALIAESKSQVPSDTEFYGPKAQKAGQAKQVKTGQCGFNFQGLTGDRKKILGTGNPDTVLLDLDWSSIEVRLQASPKLYNDLGQRKILLEGIDPHAYIASQVCGREITKDDPERSTIGKTANFSLAYGCGVANLQQQLSMAQGKPVSESVARRVYEAWHKFHPQISRKMAEFDSGARKYEERSLSGRRMCVRSMKAGKDGIRARWELSRTNGVNFPIQGSGKDLLADAVGDLWVALDQFPGVRVVGLIHDEILLEVPRDSVEEVKAVALGCMTSERLQEAYLGDIELKADAKVGESWGEAH